MSVLHAASWNKDGSRQIIQTGCRSFDTQISALSQGNVFGSTITGRYIRPHCETECNGFTFPEGHLQAFDLKVFQPLPSQLGQAVKMHTRTSQGILYKLFHTSGSRQVIHGYIYSNTDHNLVNMWVTGRRSESRHVVTACLPYLVNVETLSIGLLAEAMKYHAEQTQAPPAGAVFRHTSEYGIVEYPIYRFEDSSRRQIMEAAGYVLAGKRWCWSDGATFETLCFFPASMFDSRFERIN